MVSHTYPTIPSQEPPEDNDHEGFPRPEKDDDVQYTHVERLLGYAPAKRKRTWLRVVMIVIIVAIVAGAGFFAVTHIHASHTSTPTKTTQAVKTPAAATTQLKAYTSSTMNLGFNYPETWGVVDGGSGKLTITSPATQLKNAAGKNVQGRIVVTIRNQQTGLPEFKSGSAVAAITSQRVSYSKPTSDQRAQTYLSFLNYASSTQNGIDGIYITGDNGYQKGQAIPESDVLESSPLVTVGFLQCSDSACSSTGAAVTLSTSEWSSSSFSAPILSILTSLSIQ